MPQPAELVLTIDAEHEATIRRETAGAIAAGIEARARDFAAHQMATSAAVLLDAAQSIRRHYGATEKPTEAKEQ